MGKTLRVLSIIFLLLSGVSLWLGIYLFGKREILKGRTQKLENEIITLGAFLEREVAEPEPNAFPAKDTSDCTSELLDSPSRSDFWNSYALHLEKQDNATMTVGNRKTELMSYYKVDPITLKVERDAQGYKVTEGKGTMQNLLDEMTENAKDQLRRMNETRQQLTVIRDELINTIEELNRRKSALRQALNEIVQLKDQIRSLEETIANLEQKIRDLEAEKVSLQDRIAELEQNIRKLEDDVESRDEEIKKLNQIIKDLRAKRQWTTDPTKTVFLGKIGPGDKGKVITVNHEWNYVVMEVTDDFIREVTADDGSLALGVRLLIKRADQAETFVTKVVVTQIKRDEGLAIGSILPDWQQAPVQEGDVVFFF